MSAYPCETCWYIAQDKNIPIPLGTDTSHIDGADPQPAAYDLAAVQTSVPS